MKTKPLRKGTAPPPETNRVLAIDIGSSSTRAALFDDRGRRLEGPYARAYSLRYAVDGAAELDPLVLRRALREALAHFRSRKQGFDRIASCAFWHGLLGLDGKLRPLTPIYTWADSRSQSDATALRAEFSENKILQRTGCMLRFAFWPAKLRWLRRTQPVLYRRVRFWVSPSDWTFQNEFGELATSPSMASANGLFDQTTHSWDAEMCDALGISPAQLSPIRDWMDNGKILTPIGDGAASNLGSGAAGEDVAAINLGTSAAARVMTNRCLQVPTGLFRYVVNANTFVVGGAISNAGNLQQWCQHNLRTTRLARIDRKQAATGNIVAFPFFVAERAPDWPEIPATIFGLEFATTRAEILRALITSVFYRLAGVLDSLEQSTAKVRRIIVSGGMSESTENVAILADALGRDVEIATEAEASLRGAAVHALGHDREASRGKVVHCNRELAEKHRARREKQQQMLAKIVAAFAENKRAHSAESIGSNL